jgi:hypothetical protein
MRYYSVGDLNALEHSFTEHGAIMVATILNSPRAIEMSLYVVRAFVQTDLRKRPPWAY